MIKDIKEIIGIIFMIIVGIMMLAAIGTALASQLITQFTGLAIILLVIAGLAGILSIVLKWFK